MNRDRSGMNRTAFFRKSASLANETVEKPTSEGMAHEPSSASAIVYSLCACP